LDETMVWAVAVRTRRFAYSAELHIRYVRPIRPGEAVIAEAELVADRRGRLFETRGELRDPMGVILATATGKYIPMKGQVPTDQMADLVGDFGFFGSGGMRQP
jgi:acyl-coenzyme A thioesterase PaaI-like protein